MPSLSPTSPTPLTSQLTRTPRTPRPPAPTTAPLTRRADRRVWPLLFTCEAGADRHGGLRAAQAAATHPCELRRAPPPCQLRALPVRAFSERPASDSLPRSESKAKYRGERATRRSVHSLQYGTCTVLTRSYCIPVEHKVEVQGVCVCRVGDGSRRWEHQKHHHRRKQQQQRQNQQRRPAAVQVDGASSGPG